jgi:phospholipase/lecithinase/hemolysin
VKLLPSLLLAAGIGVAGTAGALAAGEQIHKMTIQLPAGGVAHVTYTGNVAPKVVVDQNPAHVAAGDPAFAIFARVQADMDRQMGALQALFNNPALWQRPELDNALYGKPDGANDVFDISTAKGSGFCMQSVQITQNGNEKPKVVRRTAGNCTGNTLPNATLKAAPQNDPQVTAISYR